MQKLTSAKRVRIQLGSQEYFDLVWNKPEVRPWLALGQNVQFALADTIYEVFDAEATSGGKP